MGLCLEAAFDCRGMRRVESRRATARQAPCKSLLLSLLATALRGSPFRLDPCHCNCSITMGSSSTHRGRICRGYRSDAVRFFGAPLSHQTAERAGGLPRSRNRPTLKVLQGGRLFIYLHNGRAGEVHRCRRSGGIPVRVPPLHESAATRARDLSPNRLGSPRRKITRDETFASQKGKPLRAMAMGLCLEAAFRLSWNAQGRDQTRNRSSSSMQVIPAFHSWPSPSAPHPSGLTHLTAIVCFTIGHSSLTGKASFDSSYSWNNSGASDHPARRGSVAQPEPSDTESTSGRPTVHLPPQRPSRRGSSVQAERRNPCARTPAT
jgi:hypothetical protein